MIDVSLDHSENFILNSSGKKVTPHHKYAVTTKVVGITGKPFSSYFGIISLDKDNQEIDRKISWLNDRSNEEKEYKIVFQALTDHIIFIYRVNTETPVKSDCHFLVLPIEEISIKETDEMEQFDDVKNHHVIKSTSFEDELIRPKMSKEANFIINEFHKIYYGKDQPHRWENTFWLGARTLKCPLDMWIYQEIIFEVRPDFIIETGTWNGGSALFLATICDIISQGIIITIDINKKKEFPTHTRIKYLTGSSVDKSILDKIKNLGVGANSKVMVILDSDHNKKHVLKEMEIYGKLVSKDSYLIVEDTNLNGHPVSTEHGDGPMEAVEDYLKFHDEFKVDKQKEKFLMTFNPNGYLKKIR